MRSHDPEQTVELSVSKRQEPRLRAPFHPLARSGGDVQRARRCTREALPQTVEHVVVVVDCSGRSEARPRG